MILRSLSVVVLMALVVPSFAQAEALSSVAPMCGVKPSAEDISGSLGSPVHLLSNNHRRSNAVVLDSLPPGLEQDCNGLLLINSREYKMQLLTDRFTGNPLSSIVKYWDTLQEALAASGFDRELDGDLTDIKHDRTVQYFDTPDTCVLDANNFSFRERTEDGDREVDLKYRSVDRYISSHQNMEGQSSRNPESKFEEDISPLPIFHIKYSLSTKQEIGKGKNLNKMDDPIGLYPGLESYDVNPNDPIDNVGNIIIHEFVYGTDAEVDLGSVDAELNLTLWYLEGGSVTMPVIAEISFSYKDENEGFTEKVARRALQLFNVMQSLEEWNDPTSPTKTAFVYGYDPTWCAAQQMSLIQIGTRDQHR